MRPAQLSPESRERARWKSAPCAPRCHSPALASSVRQDNRTAKLDMCRSREQAVPRRPVSTGAVHVAPGSTRPIGAKHIQGSAGTAAGTAPYPDPIRGPLATVVLVIAPDCRAPPTRMSPVSGIFSQKSVIGDILVSVIGDRLTSDGAPASGIGPNGGPAGRSAK
jgi:hypothetical protein